MCQPEAFLNLAREIKKRNLTIVIYTGFTFEELQEKAKTNDAVRQLLQLTDLLIDGPFVQKQRDLTLLFRGSSNQRVIDMKQTLEEGKICLAEKYL